MKLVKIISPTWWWEYIAVLLLQVQETLFRVYGIRKKINKNRIIIYSQSSFRSPLGFPTRQRLKPYINIHAKLLKRHQSPRMSTLLTTCEGGSMFMSKLKIEEWAKIPHKTWTNLIRRNHKRLLSVVSCKGYTTDHQGANNFDHGNLFSLFKLNTSVKYLNIAF